MLAHLIKKTLKAGLVLAFWFGGPALAQTQIGTPEDQQTVVILQSAILTVETDRLFTESLYGRRIQGEFVDARNALIAENRTKEAELLAEEKELTELRATLSREEFSKLAEEFDAKTQIIRSEQGAKDTEIRSDLESSRLEFLQIIQGIFAEIMRERRALAIFSNDTVILVADSINITDDAIAKIDALIGDGTN